MLESDRLRLVAVAATGDDPGVRSAAGLGSPRSRARKHAAATAESRRRRAMESRPGSVRNPNQTWSPSRTPADVDELVATFGWPRRRRRRRRARRGRACRRRFETEASSPPDTCRRRPRRRAGCTLGQAEPTDAAERSGRRPESGHQRRRGPVSAARASDAEPCARAGCLAELHHQRRAPPKRLASGGRGVRTC